MREGWRAVSLAFKDGKVVCGERVETSWRRENWWAAHGLKRLKHGQGVPVHGERSRIVQRKVAFRSPRYACHGPRGHSHGASKERVAVPTEGIFQGNNQVKERFGWFRGAPSGRGGVTHIPRVASRELETSCTGSRPLWRRYSVCGLKYCYLH